MSVSISRNTRESFRNLDSLRPNHVSFSGMLGQAAKEYFDQHSHGSIKLDEFTNENIVLMPQMFAEIDLWIEYIKQLSPLEIKKLRQRQVQLGNILKKKIDGYLQ